MRGTNSLEAFNLFKKGVQARKLPMTFARWQESDDWFKQAIAEDTGMTFADAKAAGVGYPRAWSWMAYGLAICHFEGWQASNALAQAVEYADRSVTLDPWDYENHWVAAFAHLVNKEPTEAEDHLNKALLYCEEDLNMALRNEMADVLVWLGKTDEAIELLEKTRRISDWNHWSLAWSYYYKAKAHPKFYDLALSELDQTFWNPGQEAYELDMQLLVAAIHIQQAALHQANNEADQAEAKTIMAKAALKLFQMDRPNWTIEDELRRMPFAPAAQASREHWIDGLTKLGLPEK